MGDFARSSDPAVQHQFDRLFALSVSRDMPALAPIQALLARIGDPHLHLPPILHVAGTNGKGSTCAFLRAAVEAAGLTTHVYTSPHLVRFNERIRVAGQLIEDAALGPLIAEVLDAGGDIGASFFEVTMAAAFLAFSRTPADACILEVGLGGRFDATNVIEGPAACGIAQLGLDHQFFLGDTIEAIAGEKAGIAKPGVPLVTMRYPASVAKRVAQVAGDAGASVLAEGDAWQWSVSGDRLHYRDAAGSIETPLPALCGPHQPGNLALAIAMLRAQTAIAVSERAFQTAAATVRWPARMQRLAPGPLTAILPEDVEIWLDGGHNPAAAEAVAGTLRTITATPSGVRLPCHLILGMLANKDPEGLLAPLIPFLDSVTAVPIPGHEHHLPAELARIAHRMGVRSTITAGDIPEALGWVRRRIDPRGTPPVVLILGSLYLAGVVLEANGQLPD